MNDLQKLCWKKLEEIKNFNHPLGYHFSYSNESAWKPENRFLIFTLNPSSSDHVSRNRACSEIAINSETPWAQTEINDFFTNESANYKITPYIRTIFYELAKRDGNSGNTFEQMKEIAFNYAKTECPIASFVPFRTRNAGNITPEMYKFAEEVLWPEIFKVWLPETIIVLGSKPYVRMVKILSNSLNISPEKQEIIPLNSFSQTESSRLNYKYSKFKKDRIHTTLLYIPHPTGTFGGTKHTGIPKDFDKHCGENGTPFRQFLENTLLNE